MGWNSRIVALAMLVILLAPSPPSLAAPSASPPADIAGMTMGYTYFNRPGADMLAHNGELAACVSEATRVLSLDEQMPYSEGVAIGIRILSQALVPARRRGVVAAALEDCMVVRGWRVVRISDPEGAALAGQSAAELSSHLAAWVGAQAPHGEIIRVWGNDAARASTTRYELRPNHINDGQLSLKAATGGDLTQLAGPSPLDSADLQDVAPKIFDPKWKAKTLKPTELASLPPGTAIVVMRLKGANMGDGAAMSFSLANPVPNSTSSNLDGATTQFNAKVVGLFSSKGGNFLAFAVVPGHWRIHGMGWAPTLNFCLGSPSFDIGPGEVIYAGTFDFKADDLGPDLSLGPAQAWLAGQSAAASIRAAKYTNGSRGTCGDNEIYALEINGAPFQPGYNWGGAASNVAN